MKGLIIFHCWNSMNHAVEIQAFDNMKSVLKQNQRWLVLWKGQTYLTKCQMH